ncbi:MAG TPA: hypothetical protein DFS52_01140 [Myxococcales bacterium]|jgi:RNA polymerase sigma-70 factor (ECF subfamily)|nr:hypothetical protein [Myxococcales bacterium]
MTFATRALPLDPRALAARVDAGRPALLASRAQMASLDNQALADLYRRFGPALHRRALSLLGDEQEALDVTQESFLALMTASGSLRGGASPFTVLYQIATFKAVDRLRRRSRWAGVLSEVAYDEDASWPQASAGESDARRVDAARDLAILTQGEKPQVLTAALLYFVEGYTTEEIGQTLDLSRKTVGKLLARFAQRARDRSKRLKEGQAA